MFAAPAAIAPDPATLALARRLAEAGTLASLLPLMARKETDELLAGQPDLSEPERATLRAIAAARFAATRERLMDAEARAFAAALSPTDLRVLVGAAESGAARRQRAAMPGVIAATMQAMGGVDFKRETLADFCRATGKGCADR